MTRLELLQLLEAIKDSEIQKLDGSYPDLSPRDMQLLMELRSKEKCPQQSP